MVLIDRLPAEILGWVEAEGHPGLREQFWELARPLPIRGMMLRDIATQMAGILALASSEDYRLKRRTKNEQDSLCLSCHGR